MLLVGAMILFFRRRSLPDPGRDRGGALCLSALCSILAAVVLRERLGPRRIVAIAAGFAGTLLILKPGTESFPQVGLMPVGAGLCYAGRSW